MVEVLVAIYHQLKRALWESLGMQLNHCTKCDLYHQVRVYVCIHGIILLHVYCTSYIDYTYTCTCMHVHVHVRIIRTYMTLYIVVVAALE